MPGRLAIDFGTSNTRVAVWDEGTSQAKPLPIPDVSHLMHYRDSSSGARIEVPGIPSLIHFAGTQVLIGRQVLDRGQLEGPATFFWMKRYISDRLELPRPVDGRVITYSDAGAEFLRRVLDYASSAIGLGDEEVAFTVPVEAYEHYQDWLTRVCEKARIRRYRLLDEASAAALGYGVNIQANDVYLVVDFGGGTLDVSMVRMEGAAVGGKRCRVLGKGGAELGGTIIDQWLYQDVLARARKQPEDVRHFSTLLLLEVERAKEALTSADEAEVQVTDPRTGSVIGARYTRSRFDDLLEERGLFATLQRTIDHALAQARERGYEREHIKTVLLVGGSTLIPSVRRAVRQLFGERVQYHRPLDAVVLGGAAFVSGVDFSTTFSTTTPCAITTVTRAISTISSSFLPEPPIPRQGRSARSPSKPRTTIRNFSGSTSTKWDGLPDRTLALASTWFSIPPAGRASRRVKTPRSRVISG